METEKNELKLYTIEEVAQILSVSYQTIFKLLSGRKLEGSRVGRSWRISEKQLNEYLEKTSTTAV